MSLLVGERSRRTVRLETPVPSGAVSSVELQNIAVTALGPRHVAGFEHETEVHALTADAPIVS